MDRSHVTNILVEREGKSVGGLVIRDGDNVKCGGWVHVIDMELVIASPITEEMTRTALLRPYAPSVGDWVIQSHSRDETLPEVVPAREFAMEMDLAGFLGDRSLYRRRNPQRAFCWQGEEPLRLLPRTGGDGMQGALVLRGDWVMREESGRYLRISAERARRSLRPASPRIPEDFLGM